MNEIGDAFCPNKECKDYGLQNHGNITIRGKYGKDKTKDLLYICPWERLTCCSII